MVYNAEGQVDNFEISYGPMNAPLGSAIWRLAQCLSEHFDRLFVSLLISYLDINSLFVGVKSIWKYVNNIT